MSEYRTTVEIWRLTTAQHKDRQRNTMGGRDKTAASHHHFGLVPEDRALLGVTSAGRSCCAGMQDSQLFALDVDSSK